MSQGTLIFLGIIVIWFSGYLSGYSDGQREFRRTKEK